MPVPLVLPSSSSANGTRRDTIRHELAAYLGYFARGTVSTEAASLEGDRWVISTNWQSDQAPPSELDGLWLYVRDGDEAESQRRVMDGSFDGPLGAALVDAPYASGPLAQGTGVEVSVLPAEAYLGASGLNDIINLALRELPVIDYLPITITATAGVPDTEYALINYSWPIKAIKAVIYPRNSTSSERRREVSRADWNFDLDAESPVLSFIELPAQVGDEIEVRFHRPASTRIRQGGVWGNTTTGMTSDADECLYDAATVVEKAKPIALERMALRHERGSPDWLSLKNEAVDGRRDAAFARFYSGFRGSGAQSAGASYRGGVRRDGRL